MSDFIGSPDELGLAVRHAPSVFDAHPWAFLVAAIICLSVVLLAVISMAFRIVVSTNEVHIVQSGKKTTSYGKDQPAGNTYYKWPSWIPVIGVKVIVLPVSVFSLKLENYASYDKGRVPFSIDIMSFFRISDSNEAAQRVHTFQELNEQLRGILQGAIRSILASSDIEEILEGRSRFGQLFTEAVDVQLKAWGVVTVKNVELMDIRDAEQSNVIQNIMAKKKSLIERESRITVAENQRAAKEAEIVANRDVNLRAQEAEEQVGQRTAQKDRQIGIANQKALQDVTEEQRVTATKEMAVRQVQIVTAAEIEKAAKIVAAEQQKQQTITVAEGDLERSKLRAQGVEVEGRAKGEAEKAVLLAPVAAQTALAKEIGQNPGYQTYLVSVRTIEKDQVVGVAQAQALQDAEIKVIANSGSVVGGVQNIMDLLTPQGGTQLGAMMEAFQQTPAGKQILSIVRPPKEEEHAERIDHP